MILAATLPLALAARQTPRLELSADSNWRFVASDPGGAEGRAFDDSGWRRVDLPHDWSIEGTPAKDNPTGSGGGFYPAGVGWYRKRFTAPADWKGRQVSVEFDGVYRNATVYLNGRKLGTQPYGYTSFRFDITPGIDFAAANVLAVAGGQFGATQQPLVQRVRDLPACAGGGDGYGSCRTVGRICQHATGERRQSDHLGSHAGGE